MNNHYIFLTREVRTTLPSKENGADKEVANLQYLGDLKSDVESPKEALSLFLKENKYLQKYEIKDFIIKRYPNSEETFYL